MISELEILRRARDRVLNDLVNAPNDKDLIEQYEYFANEIAKLENKEVSKKNKK